MRKSKDGRKPRKRLPGHGTPIRIGDDPTDVTLHDGTALTLSKGKGRFRVLLVTEQPIRSKTRRKAS